MTQKARKYTKRSTDEIINGAIDRQQSWLTRRRMLTRAFLRKINVFARSEKKTTAKPKEKAVATNNESVLRAYWFPIVCALIVIFIAVIVACVKINTPVKVIVPEIPEPIIQPVNTSKTSAEKAVVTPSFDLVRIEDSGRIIIAGRNVDESNISIVANNKVIATEHTNKDGEFVYAAVNAWKPGNYAIYLIDTDKNIKSADTVFVYINEHDYKKSMSLLMTKDGSKIMQNPKLQDGDLKVTRIDYTDTGRLVVSGHAIPRLRVSLTLNDKYLGFARVSDAKNFGLGADIKPLQPGVKYTLTVRLHDTNGTTIAKKEHKFTLPKPTGCDDTFYMVRRGDTLWVIARNFLRRGALYPKIASCNAIKNPNRIFPKQVLQIPVD